MEHDYSVECASIANGLLSIFPGGEFDKERNVVTVLLTGDGFSAEACVCLNQFPYCEINFFTSIEFREKDIEKLGILFARCSMQFEVLFAILRDDSHECLCARSIVMFAGESTVSHLVEIFNSVITDTLEVIQTYLPIFYGVTWGKMELSQAIELIEVGEDGAVHG
jgi:hypothetical protein